MTPEEIKEAAAAIKDGIYFGLPMDVYREVNRLSSSAIQKILISPATFWRDSWLNPNPPVLTPEQKRNRERAKLLGSAYHCARLEPDEFEVRYVRGLAQEDMPEGTLFTGTQMSAALKEKGLPVSGSVGEQAARLKANGFPVEKLWHLQLIEWEAGRGEREAIPATNWDEILVDMQRLRDIPEVAEKLSGGEAEVSIFWTCPETGLKMKVRLDYLAPQHWSDFKSYANSQGKHVDQAICDAFAYNRYFVQWGLYHEAVEMVRSGVLDVISGTPEQRMLIAQIETEPDELASWYIFQEKDGVPNVFAYEVELFDVPVSAKVHHPITDDPARHAAVERGQRTKTALHVKARVHIRRAKEMFAHYSDAFLPGEPWRPINPIGRINDASFSPYWLERTT